MHFLDAADVLCGDDSSLPRTLLINDAAEMDDAVAYHDVESERTPVILLQRVGDAAANMIVVGGRIGNFAGEARDRLQEIGARHDADELLAPHDRKPLELVLFH